MKKLLIILDGVGDLGVPEFGGKTPLEAARKPNLDRLAAVSEIGCTKIAGDLAPESDVGVFAVLGFDPYAYHVGRGALEAWGIGAGFKGGMLGLRANFATSDESGRKLLDRRVGRSLTTGEAKALEREINAKVRLAGASFVFRASVAHRAVVMIEASGMSKEISNVDPAYSKKNGLSNAEEKFEMVVPDCAALGPGAEKSAALVNEFVAKAHGVLQESKVNERRVKRGLLPANAILLRDAETKIKKPARFFGSRWAILADMPLEIGIAKLVKMKIVKLPLPTFEAGDYPLRAKKTLEALEKFDGVYVHLKGPDLPAHDGDAAGKLKSINEIDEFYFGPLLKKLDLKNTRVLVTADHCTPCVKAAHSADSVPYMITDGKKRPNKFEEGYCRRTPPVPACTLLGKLLK